MAVDDPLVAVADGASLEGTGVGAGLVRLGHGEAGLHGPGDQGLEPLLLLLGGSVLDQDLLIAGVRRQDAEDGVRVGAPGQDLVHVGQLQEADAHAAVLLREMRCPEPRFLCHVDQARPLLDPVLVAAAKEVLIGNDVIRDDVGRHQTDLVGLVIEGGDG